MSVIITMNDQSEVKRKIIGSVQRAIDILNLFEDNVNELGVTDIAKALGLHKSTASGLIQTLEINGYLEQNPDNRKYRLGLKLVERASVLLNQIQIRDIAMPYLEELHSWCDEAISLAVRDGTHVVYIERLLSSQALGMRTEVGKRASVHSTALGRAILSRLPDSELHQIAYSMNLYPITQHTITAPEALIEDIRESRERGFAIDDEENELGARCVSAAIMNHLGEPVAAISISVPIPRIPYKKVDYFGEKVVEVTRKISAQLGYRAE